MKAEVFLNNDRLTLKNLLLEFKDIFSNQPGLIKGY